MQHPPVVLSRVVRNGLVESIHLGSVAVCDADGRLVASAGDPDAMLFARSSMKPLQAAVSLEAIGSAEGLTPKEVAVMCASHNGEPVHLEAMRSILERAGLDAGALRNPPGRPVDLESAIEQREARPDLHNCSGKHAGMLLACVRQGWDIETYQSPGHPLQERVMATVLEATDRDEVEVGVDGCGVPVHGMRLRDMATLYARLARPERLGDLARPAATAVGAMLAEPYLVAGRDRVDTAVMDATGDVALKYGAEGLQCAAALGPGLGIAVKCADGAPRGCDPAVVRVLALLDLVTRAQLDTLELFAEPPLLGKGVPQGHVTCDFELERAPA
jgi:L-asparaginase II